MKWVFVKKDAATPSFFAYGDAIVPPRFQWQSDTQNDFRISPLSIWLF